MRFGRLDLNLLVALDALLDERSVSLAADRLCLSQSATSSALGRLREYFRDDLLVLKGRNMVLTPRAEELIEPVRAVLEQVRATIAVMPEFDPSTCDRQIRMMASDYVTEVLLTPALAEMEVIAPKMRFEIQQMASAPTDSLERGMVDLLISVDFAMSAEHPRRDIFQDDHVVVADPNNELIHGGITPELYFSLGHVTTRFGRSRVPTFEDWFMRRQKQQRRIEVVAPTFLSLPGLVVGTKRIATVQRLLAERFSQRYGLVLHELPFDIPPIRESVQWNVSNKNDMVLLWVVERLVATAEASLKAPDATLEDVGAGFSPEFHGAKRGVPSGT